MGVLGGLILKPVGGDQAGVFDGVTKDIFGSGDIPGFEVTNFEFNFTLTYPDDGTTAYWGFIQSAGASPPSGNGGKSGYVIAHLGTGKVRLFFRRTNTDRQSTDTLNAGLNTIQIKSYGGDVFMKLNSGSLNNEGASGNLNFGTPDPVESAIGVDSGPQNYIGDIHIWTMHELDGSGNRIAELVNLNWNGGNTNTVPNIGADSPASSDLTWVPAGSGTYVDI